MPNPFTGQPWPWESTPTKTDTGAREAAAQSFGDRHGGILGSAPPTDSKGNVTKGFTRYTAQDGSTVDISDDGSQITNYLPSTQSNQAAAAQQPGKTAADIAAQSGLLFGPGGQVYVKNPTPEDGRGPYIQSTDTAGKQQIDQAKTVADTRVQTLAAQKTELDNQVLADPTNQAALAQKQQIDNQYQQALTQKAAIDAAATQQNAAATMLNAQTTASRAPSEIDLATSQAAYQRVQAAVAQGKAPAEIDLLQAQAANQLNQAQIAQGKLPSEIDLATSQAINQRATAAATTAKAAQPTILDMGAATAPTTTYWDPTQQKMVTQPNPNYQPTDPGRMTMQLQQQMQAQHDQLNQQIASGSLSPDQATSQWNQWYAQNIEPLKQDIAQAQATQQADLQYKQAQTAYEQFQPQYQMASLANTASNQAQQNALSLASHLANANAPQLMQQAITTDNRGFATLDPSKLMQASTFSVPNLQEIGRQGAAAALANISPTAQMHLGTPGPPMQAPMPGLDLGSLLNQNASQYAFGGPAGATSTGAVGAPAGLPPTVGGPGQNMVDLSAMPGAGPGGAQSTLLNPSGMNLAVMPGYVPGYGQSGPALPWQAYQPTT